jgi:hypothetical protein
MHTATNKSRKLYIKQPQNCQQKPSYKKLTQQLRTANQSLKETNQEQHREQKQKQARQHGQQKDQRRQPKSGLGLWRSEIRGAALGADTGVARIGMPVLVTELNVIGSAAKTAEQRFALRDPTTICTKSHVGLYRSEWG